MREENVSGLGNGDELKGRLIWDLSECTGDRILYCELDAERKGVPRVR